MNGYLSLCVHPVTHWQHDQGVPKGSWDRLPPTLNWINRRKKKKVDGKITAVVNGCHINKKLIQNEIVSTKELKKVE